MGALFSRFEPAVVDGRGTVATQTTPLYEEIIRKSPESKEKLAQLLRALVNYEPTNVGTILVSLWFLGADKQELTLAFDTLSKDLRQWPEENAIADSLGDFSLAEFYGNKEYLQRYFEFFRDQLTEFTQWHEIIVEYFPMVGERLLLADQGPLQLLAAAVEIDDPVLAMHALAWACAAQSEDLESASGGPLDLETSTNWLALQVLQPLVNVDNLVPFIAEQSVQQLPFTLAKPRDAPQLRAQVVRVSSA